MFSERMFSEYFTKEILDIVYFKLYCTLQTIVYHIVYSSLYEDSRQEERSRRRLQHPGSPGSFLDGIKEAVGRLARQSVFIMLTIMFFSFHP